MTAPAPAPAPAPNLIRFFPGTRVQLVDRENFLMRRWRYNDGEHVTFLGPTQSGKTTFAFQCLACSANPRRQAVVLVMKPHRKASTRETGDKTIVRWQKALGYRLVRGWPPAVRDRKTAGYVLWPKHTFDPARDDEILYREFRKALLDNYKRGDSIVFGDEVIGLATELKLTRELRTIWMRGASMGTGLWTATQRPREIPLYAYSQAEHVFMAYTPDEADRERYSEIGGVDPKIVKHITARLPKYHWLYVRRTGPAMCVVLP